jgi:hypothetical protein
MEKAAIVWRPFQLQAFLPDPSTRARILYPQYRVPGDGPNTFISSVEAK